MSAGIFQTMRLEVKDNGSEIYVADTRLKGNDELLGVYISPQPEVREAFAALIVAAPDLLAALEAILSGSGTVILTRLREQGEAAIAKAKGGVA